MSNPRPRWWWKFMPGGSRWYERAIAEEEKLRREAEARKRQLERRLGLVVEVQRRRRQGRHA